MTPWAKLAAALAERQGCRLGEASVVSLQVHTIDPSQPGVVTVLGGADAGQTFYQRVDPGQVVHLDLFHSVGEVEHRAVAAALCQELADEVGPFGEGRLLDYIDIQTGTGGGRITGSLAYGQKASLRASHRNHVHLTVLLPAERLPLLQRLAGAVEAEVLRQGFELRRIEGLRWQPPGAQGAPADLSPYTDASDSWLRGSATPPASEGDALAEALAIAKQVGSPEELKRALDQLSGEGGKQPNPYLLRQLEEAGVVRRDLRGAALTPLGLRLRGILARHLQELRLRFRKQVRRVPGGLTKPEAGGEASEQARYGPVRDAVRLARGAALSDLAVPETVKAAVVRSRGRFSLGREDLMVYRRAAAKPLHICLLVDASASMAGRRLQAAKHLARHLLASTRDRVAVVAFQEREVKVYVPFTRDWAQVEEGLARIQPLGLTPLAHGLVESLELIKASRVARPLLLLITDGIPTVPKWGVDPLADALEAAKRVAKGRVPFGCIGLQPSRRYLTELARIAGGTLHVVEELEESSLIRIAHRERGRYRA